MKRPWFPSVIVALIAVLTLGFPSVGVAADLTLTMPDGSPVVWSDWVADQAPVAVLLWASWIPSAEETLADLDQITAAARAKGLNLVIVAVQETLEEAAESLEGIDVGWLHDRYGHLLKDYRVVVIPRLLVFAEDGQVVERLEVSPRSLRTWGGE